MISKYKFFYFFIFLYGFVFSYLFTPFHYGGDAVHYQLAYEAAGQHSNIFDAYASYLSKVFSKEIFHFLISWFFSYLNFEKLFVTSVLNGLLYVLSVKIVFRFSGSFLLAILIVITNYYLLALFFTLEKFKVAIIFFFFSILYSERKKIGGVFLFVSALSHFQMLIFFIGYVVSNFFKKDVFRKSFFNKKFLLFVFFGSCFSVLLMFFYKDFILDKFYSYYKVELYKMSIDFIKIFSFGFFVFILSGLKPSVFIFFIVLSIFSALLGSERIFIFCYFYFLFVAFNAGQIGMFFVLLGSCFVFYKSIIYILMIIQTGG